MTNEGNSVAPWAFFTKNMLSINDAPITVVRYIGGRGKLTMTLICIRYLEETVSKMKKKKY